MKITVIHGSERKGSTYHMAQLFLQEIVTPHDGITEFFLPRDMSSFCKGCANCFAKGEDFCPHHEQVAPIHQAMKEADLILFTTPVYVLRASGQMKTLLDHLAYLFMTHRPDPTMFSKIGVILSTGAGGGTRSAIKDIRTSLKFWGVARTYTMGARVFASEWGGVSKKAKQDLTVKMYSLAQKARPKIGRVTPGISTKILFHLFRFFHKKWGFNEKDVTHWEKKGWLNKARPWQ